MTKTITGEQIKRICAMAAGLHMLERNNPEDPLHILVCGMTGKCSLKELTYKEAQEIAGELDSRIRQLPLNERPKSKRKQAAPAAQKGMMTKAQQGKAWSVIYRMAELEPNNASVGDRMAGAIKEVLGVTVLNRKDMFRWVSKEDGQRLINQLDRFLDTVEKRCMRKAK